MNFKIVGFETPVIRSVPRTLTPSTRALRTAHRRSVDSRSSVLCLPFSDTYSISGECWNLSLLGALGSGALGLPSGFLPLLRVGLRAGPAYPFLGEADDLLKGPEGRFDRVEVSLGLLGGLDVGRLGHNVTAPRSLPVWNRSECPPSIRGLPTVP